MFLRCYYVQTVGCCNNIKNTAVAMSVIMEKWTAHLVLLLLKLSLKINESVTATSRFFRNNIHAPRLSAGYCRHTIETWVNNFKNSAFALQVKPTGKPCYGRGSCIHGYLK